MTWVAVVTGGNKGIGKEIALSLCEYVLKDRKGLGTVWIGSRDAERGEAAVEEVNSKLSQAVAKLLPLAVDDQESVKNAAKTVQDQSGPIDVLVNNAGWNGEALYSSLRLSGVMQQTLATNYWGVRYCTDQFQLRRHNGSRVIVLSSDSAELAWNSSADKCRAQLVACDTVAKLDSLAQELSRLADSSNQLIQAGWTRDCYGISKLLVTQYTLLLGRATPIEDTFFSSVHPGWCKSDMGGWHGPTLTSADGARTPVWLATMANPQPDFQGGFFEKMKLSNFIR